MSAVTPIARSPAPEVPSGRLKEYWRAVDPPAARVVLCWIKTSTRVAPVVVLTTRTRSYQPPVVAAEPVLRSFQRTVTAPPDWSEAWATVRPVTLRSGEGTNADAVSLASENAGRPIVASRICRPAE